MGDHEGGVSVADYARQLRAAAEDGDLWIMHVARFATVHAVVDCAQALTALFARKGAWLHIIPLCEGGFRLELAHRIELGKDLHEPVRAIVEWHGGTYDPPSGHEQAGAGSDEAVSVKRGGDGTTKVRVVASAAMVAAFVAFLREHDGTALRLIEVSDPVPRRDGRAVSVYAEVEML